jgi:hypothetical protein
MLTIKQLVAALRPSRDELRHKAGALTAIVGAFGTLHHDTSVTLSIAKLPPQARNAMRELLDARAFREDAFGTLRWLRPPLPEEQQVWRRAFGLDRQSD